MSNYAHPEALVETAWLAEHASDANVRVFEVDVDTAAYEQGHVAGAVGLNWKTELQQQPVRDLISKEQLEALLSTHGVTADTTIAVYGDNNNWATAVAADGRFKPADELREIYSAKGVTGAGETIAYCRIGERSSHTWFVLKYLLGHEKTRNYDGSWTEYGSLIGVPIETGATT